ncbi:MAG TPA: hypothetical protein VHQ65_16695 [Thermoanaerobaculia bacterium]|nr:hypothetical protein [Thermoanaerobaculia bacterium]
MKNKIVLTALAAVLAAAPAFAGTLYVPMAVDKQIDGELQRTLVWVTNPTGTPQQFEMRFISTGTDGTEGEADRKVTVPPLATVVVNPAPAGGLGIAELTGPDELIYVGELNSFGTDGQLIDSSAMPLVGSQNLIAAGAPAHLQALEREVAGTRTNLGITNLGTGEAACTVKAFRPSGAQIQGTATVPVAPLGHIEFSDAFDILQEPSIDGARFEISCNEPFYPYAAIYGEFPDFVKFVGPSESGASNLLPPGDRPISGELVRQNGSFFLPRTGDSYMEIDLPIPAGQRYDSLSVEFDMQTSKFPTTFFISTFGLLRPVRGGTYFAHTIRGNNGKSILDMGIGEIHDGGIVHRGETGVWEQNGTHNVRVHYDTVNGTILWEVRRGGQLVERIQGAIGRFNLVHNGEGFKLIFGLSKVYGDGAFFPPWNFRFSNLVVRGVPSS